MIQLFSMGDDDYMAVISKSKHHLDNNRKKWTLSNISNGCLVIISTLLIVMAAILIFSMAECNHINDESPSCVFMLFCIIAIFSRQFFTEKIVISNDTVTLYTISPKMKNAEVISCENIVISDVPDHDELLEIQLYSDGQIINTFLVMV